MARPQAKPSTYTIAPALPPERALRRLLVYEFSRLQHDLLRITAACQGDRYRKHFTTLAHACLLLFHGLSRGQSLRQSYAAMSWCPGVLAVSGLAATPGHLAVSYSQVAASNTSRPAAVLVDLIPVMLARIRQRGVRTSAIPLDLHILDTTFLRVSLTLAGWLPISHHPRNRGVRIPCHYHPATDLPAQVLVTTMRRNDVQSLDAMLLNQPEHLHQMAGQTLLLDLGFYSHRRLAALTSAGIHFVTRLHPQARVTVTAARALQPALDPTLKPPSRITVLLDQEVTVGSPTNRAGAVLTGLRLVTAEVQPTPPAARLGTPPVIYQILTDRLDLDPDQLVQCYLWRWQIELFFRWLKSQIRLPRLLGYSQNAIELSVALAILVHLFCLLAAEVVGCSRRNPLVLTLLAIALVQWTAHDDQDAGPHQLALPLALGPP
jgi:hypothetical protein